MSLDNLSREEIDRLSMQELAKEILLAEKKAMDFRDIFNKVAELKGFTEQQKTDLLAQFYTDLNVDGKFITLGANMWGLKRWYPFEQMDEDIHNEPKKKKKKSKKKVDDDLDLEDEDLELDLDDEELDDEDFDDIDEEDEDFEEIEDEDFDEFDDDDDDDVDDELEDLNEIEEEEEEDFDEEK